MSLRTTFDSLLELQATFRFRGREITVIVSHDDVLLERMPPEEDGSVGKLLVYLVDANDRGRWSAKRPVAEAHRGLTTHVS